MPGGAYRRPLPPSMPPTEEHYKKRRFVTKHFNFTPQVDENGVRNNYGGLERDEKYWEDCGRMASRTAHTKWKNRMRAAMHQGTNE